MKCGDSMIVLCTDGSRRLATITKSLGGKPRSFAGTVKFGRWPVKGTIVVAWDRWEDRPAQPRVWLFNADDHYKFGQFEEA